MNKEKYIKEKAKIISKYSNHPRTLERFITEIVDDVLNSACNEAENSLKKYLPEDNVEIVKSSILTADFFGE